MPRVKTCSSNASLETQFDTQEVLGTMKKMIFTDKPQVSDFDTDNLLDQMFPNQAQQVDTQVKTCPRCYETLIYDEVDTKKGDVWRYYRCTALNDYTKCYVACGADDVDLYLDKVRDPAPRLRERLPGLEPALLLQPVPHPGHVKVREEQVPTIFQVPQGDLQFFPMGRFRSFWKSAAVVRPRREPGCQTQGTETQALRSGQTRADETPF